MAKAKKNAERERRIENEIIVDAYGPEEQAMGWYYYLEEKLHFPFRAKCIAERAISPLHKGDEVEVLKMAAEEECQHEVFVMMRWELPILIWNRFPDRSTLHAVRSLCVQLISQVAQKLVG